MARKQSQTITSSFDKLSRERTLLANERTMLAHIRTSVALVAFGLGAVELLDDYAWSNVVGVISVALGGLLFIFGIVYYPIRNRRIKQY